MFVFYSYLLTFRKAKSEIVKGIYSVIFNDDFLSSKQLFSVKFYLQSRLFPGQQNKLHVKPVENAFIVDT